jgi:hypothetical protein
MKHIRLGHGAQQRSAPHPEPKAGIALFHQSDRGRRELSFVNDREGVDPGTRRYQHNLTTAKKYPAPQKL